jgi:hypothetical protein
MVFLIYNNIGSVCISKGPLLLTFTRVFLTVKHLNMKSKVIIKIMVKFKVNKHWCNPMFKYLCTKWKELKFLFNNFPLQNNVNFSFYWKKWFYIWYMALASWLVLCLPFPDLPHIYFLFTVRLICVQNEKN